MTLAKFKAKLAKRRAKLEAVQYVTRTIRLCGWEKVYHEAINFVVDRAFIADLTAYLDWSRARGHLPSILRQHTEDGENYGVVKGLEAREDGPWLVLGMHPTLAAKYDAGRVPYWSPHFEWDFPDPHRPAEDDPSKPHVWPVRLRELSFVSVPHLLNNPPANVQLGGPTTTKSARVMCAAPQQEDKKMELTPEEIAALKALAGVAPALVAMVQSDDAELADPKAPEDPAKTGAQMADPKMPETQPAAMAALSGSIATLSSKVTTLDQENKTLKATLASQQRKTVESEVAADTAGLTLTDDEKKTLVSLKLASDATSQSAYATVIKAHRAVALASGGTTEIGAVGNAAKLPTGGAEKVKAAALKAKTAGVAFGAPLLKHLREQEGLNSTQFGDDEWAAVDAAYGMKS